MQQQASSAQGIPGRRRKSGERAMSTSKGNTRRSHAGLPPTGNGKQAAQVAGGKQMQGARMNRQIPGLPAVGSNDQTNIVTPLSGYQNKPREQEDAEWTSELIENLLIKEIDKITMSYQDSDNELIECLADDLTRHRGAKADRIDDLREKKDEVDEELRAAEKAALPALSTEEREQELKSLKHKKADVIEEVLRGREALMALKSEEAKNKRLNHEKKAAIENLKKDAESRLPLMTYLASILVRVSDARITVDPNNSGIIRGFVRKEETSDVRPFEFDTEKESRYHAVNKLWALISHE